MKKPEMDLIEYISKKGYNEIADNIKEYRKNIIKICPSDKENELPIGSSKFGGYPDLPSEIPYPTMSGYSCKRGNQTERYEESAMQLVAQFNLADLAEYDHNNKLPHTGMLYFFWSGEIMPIHEKNNWYESIADNPDNADYHKVIWYNGDLSQLKRTVPAIPYYSKYFTEVFDERPIHFDFDVEYQPLGYVLDEEQFDELSEIAPEYDIDDLCYGLDKLFGYPSGANIPDVNERMHLLFQYDYSLGCLWNIFWLISDEDLGNRDFSKAIFSVDMD